MLFIRLSLMKPLPGHAQRVIELNEALLEFFRVQDGFIRGFRLDPVDHTGEVGRLTIWQSEGQADIVARHQHSMAIRSELLPVIDEGEHREHAFHAYPVEAA